MEIDMSFVLFILSMISCISSLVSLFACVYIFVLIYKKYKMER